MTLFLPSVVHVVLEHRLLADGPLDSSWFCLVFGDSRTLSMTVRRQFYGVLSGNNARINTHETLIRTPQLLWCGHHHGIFVDNSIIMHVNLLQNSFCIVLYIRCQENC